MCAPIKEVKMKKNNRPGFGRFFTNLISYNLLIKRLRGIPNIANKKQYVTTK